LRADRRKVLLVGAQLVAAALLLFYVGRTLVAQWVAFRAQPLDAHPRWLWILASGALVLLAHAVLVQTLRSVMAGWNASLSFWNMARIWSVSGFGKYVPGKIWQVTALGAMAHRAGAPPVAAAGSAVLSTIVNIATGIALVLGLGWSWLDVLRADARGIAIVLVALSALGLASLPFVLPRVGGMVARLTGRQEVLVAPPPRVIFAAVAGNVLAWAMYGVAFMWFVRGVVGEAHGPTWLYVAVYTASYVVGYLFIFSPGGIGPREIVMMSLMTALALTTVKQALLVAAASRVWLTILEIVPGLLFLVNERKRRRPSTTPSDVPTD